MKRIILLFAAVLIFSFAMSPFGNCAAKGFYDRETSFTLDDYTAELSYTVGTVGSDSSPRFLWNLRINRIKDSGEIKVGDLQYSFFVKWGPKTDASNPCDWQKIKYLIKKIEKDKDQNPVYEYEDLETKDICDANELPLQNKILGTWGMSISPQRMRVRIRGDAVPGLTLNDFLAEIKSYAREAVIFLKNTETNKKKYKLE